MESIAERVDYEAQAELDKQFERMFIEEETESEPDERKEVRQNLE